ncbi:calcium/sodium antiporter [Albidovulum sp.]
MVYILFLVGLAGLFLGGDLLVRGAVAVARRFAISPIVIGATIIGFGTSAPELLVSLQAALAGTPALAIGNVVGSNIANILLILGSAAVISTVPIGWAAIRRDFLLMLAATLALWAALASGRVARPEGLLLTLGLAGYLAICLRVPRDAPDLDSLAAGTPPLWRAALQALVGLVALVIGARLLVTSASEIARMLGVGEAAIGLTVVAIGTSLPELAIAIAAALRRHSEIVLGNILGSNIFNALGIIGLSALVTPIAVEDRFIRCDMPIALAAALVPAALAATTGRAGRLAGLGLLCLYALYTAWTTAA